MDSRELVILEPAILGLADHLRRNGSQIPPDEVRRKVTIGLNRNWGTPSAKPFTDSVGPGWLVDLSEQFNEEMLYGVVRSLGGSRQVVAIVEADDIEALQRKKKPLPSVEGAYGEPDAGSTVRSTPAPDSPAPPKTPPATATDPMLVLVIGADGPKVENMLRTTQAELHDIVSGLLADGIRAEQIEIWTGVRKPKVKIAFE